MSDFRRLLGVLGYEEHDQMVVCSTAHGGFRSYVAKGMDEAERVVEDCKDGDTWFGVNPMRPLDGEGRGRAADVVRLTSLWADLDCYKNGLDFPGAEKVIDEITSWLGQPPCAVVNSGGGLQPYWAVDRGTDMAAAGLLLKRWRMLVDSVALRHGASVDNVFDLPRILRVPGSRNHKYDEPRLVTVEFADPDDYDALSVDDLHDRLTDAGIPTPSATEPEALKSRSEWSMGESPTCEYVRAMVSGWATDVVGTDRHGWLVSQGVRIAAALRKGCLHPHDLDAVVQDLGRAFDRHIEGDRSRTPNELEGAVSWGLHAAERKTDAETAKELGDHDHRDEKRRWQFDREPWDLDDAPGEMRLLMERIGEGPLSGFFWSGAGVVDTSALFRDQYIAPTSAFHGHEVLPTSTERLDVAVALGYKTYRMVAGKKNEPPVAKPEGIRTDVLKKVLASPDRCENLRRLHGVVRTPLIEQDFSINTSPGFSNGFLYLPDAGARVEPKDVGLEPLLDLLVDFPFVHEQDRFNYLAAALMPLLVVAVPSSTCPLLVVNAHQAGSGKTLLAEILRVLHGGALVKPQGDEAELQKALVSRFKDPHGPVTVFDNVHGTFTSPALEGLLTAPVWSARELGSNAMGSFRNSYLWVITGNNTTLGADMMRRTLWCSINPDMTQPWTRTGYKHANLLMHVQEHRIEILSWLYGLVVSWRDAGCPMPADTYADSFGVMDIATAVLNHAGLTGDCRDTSNQPTTLSNDDEELLDLLVALRDEFGDGQFTAKDVVDQSYSRPTLRDALPSMPTLNSQSVSRWLGYKKLHRVSDGTHDYVLKTHEWQSKRSRRYSVDSTEIPRTKDDVRDDWYENVMNVGRA